MTTFTEALVDAILRGPDPRVVAWTRDPQPSMPLTGEEAEMLANPPQPPKVERMQAEYTPPPVPEGVDEDAADELAEWFAGDALRVLNVLDQFPSGCCGLEIEAASLAAEAYAGCRAQGRIPKGAPVADDVTAAYAVDVAMGRDLARFRAERATNAAEMQAHNEWYASPSAVAYRDLLTRIAAYRSPDAIAARIQANGERVTGCRSFADFLARVGTAEAPNKIVIPFDVAASITLCCG